MAKDTDVRATPRRVILRVQREFDITIDLDVCALQSNAVVDNYFGPDHEDTARRNALHVGLRWDGAGRCAWMNPPYSEIPLWLHRATYAIEQAPALTVCCLLPSSTSTHWFHDYLWNKRSRTWRPAVHAVQFWPKRIEFGPHSTGAKWPSIVVLLGREDVVMAGGAV